MRGAAQQRLQRPGCALGHAPGLEAIVTLRDGVSPVHPAVEPIRRQLLKHTEEMICQTKKYL